MHLLGHYPLPSCLLGSLLFILVSLASGISTSNQCENVLPDTIVLNTTQRIFNGHVVMPGTANYLVSFHRRPGGPAFCTGSLISERWVLTAAHCDIRTSSYARLGGTTAKRGSLRFITKVVLHDRFGEKVIWEREILDDDIAIVQLAKKAPSDMKFMLINDNSSVPVPSHWARVSGYGVTGSDRRDMGTLHSLDLPVLSSTRCSSLYFDRVSSDSSDGLVLKDDKQFCAGYKDGRCDVCQGDSGAPLYVLDKANKPVQAGITSFGISCAMKKRPAVFTRISTYVAWMKRNGAVFTTSKEGWNHYKKGFEDDLQFMLASPTAAPKTPSITPIEGPISHPACFPGDSLVEMRDGSTKRMDEVAVGDEVLSSSNEFSYVFMFTHMLRRGTFRFLELRYATGAIILSASHYIFINGQLLPVERVQIGDELELGTGGRTRILHVSNVLREGLYNPQTMTGTIVVDGVKASAYTTAIPPKVAHGLLRPLSALYRQFQIDFGSCAFDALLTNYSG